MNQEQYNNKIIHDLTMYILKSRFTSGGLDVFQTVKEYKQIYHEVEQSLCSK